DAASRIASLIDNDGTTHLDNYSYLGAAAVIESKLVEPSLRYTLVGTAGGNDPDTGDIYRGLDRFSRIKDLLWYNDGTSSDAERPVSVNARATTRTWPTNPPDPAARHDELYLYDNLQRLRDLRRGALNSGKTGLSVQTFAQCWTLDSAGNWSQFRQDD